MDETGWLGQVGKAECEMMQSVVGEQQSVPGREMSRWQRLRLQKGRVRPWI